MKIIVSASQVSLEEANRFDDFRIISDLDGEEVERKLEGSAGCRDSQGYFWIKREWLIAQTPLSSQSSWQEGFGKMLDFAGTRGWLDPLSGAIRAHLERSS